MTTDHADEYPSTEELIRNLIEKSLDEQIDFNDEQSEEWIPRLTRALEWFDQIVRERKEQVA